MDLAITDTLALTMADDRLGILEDATIAADDGEIAFVGPTSEFEGDADRTIDGTGRVTLPGLVNVHTHTDLTLLRGGAQDVPEIEWMNRTLGPLSAAMDHEDRVAGARLGVLEALQSGVTTVGEYTQDARRIVGTAHEPLGARVVAAETINAVDDAAADLGPDQPYPLDDKRGRAGLERNEDLFDAYADHDRISCLYGPQALDMVPPALLAEIRDRAADRDRGIHMHVAQGEREQRQIEARYGSDETTVSVLEDLDIVSDRLLAAHLHGATQEERRRLAEAGVRMAANPSSIAAIDGITPPTVEYREHGGVAGVGTDQAPGPGGHDFLRELRTTALLAKTKRTDPTAFPAWAALRVGTIEGARTLGIGDRVGSLEQGKRADLVVCDLEHPSVAPIVSQPLHTAVPNLVYGASGELVETVVVDGEVVLEDATLQTADEHEILETATERATAVFERASDNWQSADSVLVDRVANGWL
ncbi:amidohydrolase family protein [Natronobacterium gregoryi]|uniref:Amidohydrolase n=2 Tax=Natronobacterium gregoryi TaxID=44930 RepID=L0AH12_NATGS|nr:amidohydrolase family protein [Natronobacterium gregoryi]AFZ72709.1 cytosine deaminase-like metal-dependent hydrolase [Natronobacterium gregoryi SP2]ELY68996.1 amidohydrolase [Natronobacterium gregoryi SP2]PLK20661.1 amidohydrolase [Natronobacterium gregoryi SP2]SFI92158.1 5-methylthioadenosine/S-adenosylhomocysteine deaminase [Natronobacterium gregoryi]